MRSLESRHPGCIETHACTRLRIDHDERGLDLLRLEQRIVSQLTQV